MHLVLCISSLLLIAFSAIAKQPVPKGFVTTQGGKFVLDGKPFVSNPTACDENLSYSQEELCRGKLIRKSKVDAEEGR